MKRALRQVPWIRPADQPYRPGRRVSPKRERGVWSWRGTLAERLRAWAWKHRLADLAIIAILFAGMFCVLYWLLDLRRAVGR